MSLDNSEFINRSYPNTLPRFGLARQKKAFLTFLKKIFFFAGLPSSVKKHLEKWNNIVLTNFPSASSWKTSSCLIEVGTENFLDSLVSAHVLAVCSGNILDIAPALKHTLHSLVQLAADLLS